MATDGIPIRGVPSRTGKGYQTLRGRTAPREGDSGEHHQAAGEVLIACALARLPAGFSSVGLLFQPVMAALFAWVLLGESLSVLQVVGGTVVLAGIALARLGSAS